MSVLDQYFRKASEILAATLAEEQFGLDLTDQQVYELLETPRKSGLGDIAFPCFRYQKQLKRRPPEISHDLCEAAEKNLESELFDGVTSAGPYVNFRISTSHLAAQVIPAINSGSFLEPRPATGERVMIEYSQPNTHKAFHVGHTRNVALGDALVRICEWAGNEVVAANYIGDEGAHIAKCLWYFKNYWKGEVPDTRRGEFLGELYSSATDLLDFTTLTQAPHPLVIAARVEALEKSQSGRNQIVTLNPGDDTRPVVLCGGTEFGVGDIVPFAKPGARIGGRLVEAVEKEGVLSEGMVCSEKEIGMGSDADKIHCLSAGVTLGEEISEIYRIDGALDADVRVVDEMKRRDDGVAEVLKALEQEEPDIHALWQETKQWSLDEFNEIYNWLDVRFDHFFYESEVSEPGKKIVDEYYEKGVLVKSEGAVGADLTEFKLPFFLLLRSNGTGLYSTKDIALAQVKFDEFSIDRSVYVVDESQSLHFKQVFKTLELMGYEKAQRCFHLAYGMVVLPDGKMSSRKGNVILFSQLRESLISEIKARYLDQYVGDWPDAEIDEAAKRTAIATIKYGMLNQDNNKNIVFDLNEWISQSGNTGPYLLYAYARIQSILEEVGSVQDTEMDWSCLAHDSEAELIRTTAQFPSVVMDAAEQCQPQMICVYLFELSKVLNRFYANCHVRNAETETLKTARCMLVSAVGEVLNQGLELVGIKTVRKM